EREHEQALVADVCHDDLGLARLPIPLERDHGISVWACVRFDEHDRLLSGSGHRSCKTSPGQDATHVTANTTLPRRPRSRLRANASRAHASGKISTDGRRSSPASASLAIDRSWSRCGSTMKYSPPSGGSSATETSRPPGRRTAPDRRSRSPPAVSNTTSTRSTAASHPPGHTDAP